MTMELADQLELSDAERQHAVRGSALRPDLRLCNICQDIQALESEESSTQMTATQRNDHNMTDGLSAWLLKAGTLMMKPATQIIRFNVDPALTLARARLREPDVETVSAALDALWVQGDHWKLIKDSMPLFHRDQLFQVVSETFVGFDALLERHEQECRAIRRSHDAAWAQAKQKWLAACARLEAAHDETASLFAPEPELPDLVMPVLLPMPPAPVQQEAPGLDDSLEVLETRALLAGKRDLVDNLRILSKWLTAATPYLVWRFRQDALDLFQRKMAATAPDLFDNGVAGRLDAASFNLPTTMDAVMTETGAAWRGRMAGTDDLLAWCADPEW